MKRRAFLKCGMAIVWTGPLMAAMRKNKTDAAADVLEQAIADGQVEAASLYVCRGKEVSAKSFGAARSQDAVFLIASISKPMSVAALMTLYDQEKFQLDDPLSKFIPEFAGDGRERVTIRQLLSHASGLPDQLPENESLRKGHADLSEFVERAIHTPLLFAPGSKYSYSSMGILLAAEVAQRITGAPFHKFVDENVFKPLEMKHSALGPGTSELAHTMHCQVEQAAPESGAGDPGAQGWDWNSLYWRSLGAPWGGVHASAPDVAKFLDDFLHPEAKVVQLETARLMLRNHNPPGLKARGLGFDIGAGVGGRGCSEATFGHGGSTGTLAWADPATDTICVVLTTLPAQAANPHPRHLTSDAVVGKE